MPDPEPFVLETPEGRRLDGFLDLPDGSGPRPVVVICHGFKGFMEWGFFPHLAELLAGRGFVAVRFNVSGAGQRPGEDRVGDPEAFRSATFTRDQEDLAAVLAAVGRELAPDRADRDRLGLFGHSRGGGTAVLAAAGEARIRALVTWAAVATFDRWSEEEKRTWRERGEHPVVNARTGQRLALGLEVLDDVEAGGVDVTAAAGRVEAPWLIVHGESDESVSFEDARTLLKAAGGEAPDRRELLAVPGAGHTFGAVHPFAGPTPALIHAMNATQTWFRRRLG